MWSIGPLCCVSVNGGAVTNGDSHAILFLKRFDLSWPQSAFGVEIESA